MGKYIHLFNAQADFETAYNGSSYEEPWVSYTDIGQDSHVDYNKGDEPTPTDVLYDLTGLGQYPRFNVGAGLDITSYLPSSYPGNNEPVLIKEPDGRIMEYTCLDFDPNGTWATYERAVTSEDASVLPDAGENLGALWIDGEVGVSGTWKWNGMQ